MKKKILQFLLVLAGCILYAQSFRLGTDFIPDQSYGSDQISYNLIFQRDGNLVVYHNGNSIWSSNTLGRGARASFQSDGNLVVYDRNNNPIFNSNTSNKGASILKLQDDGNLVIYNRRNQPIWASMQDRGGEQNENNSDDSGINGELVKGMVLPRAQKMYSSNKAYYLIFQRDGNLVFYRNGSTQPLWASNTDGRGSRAEFQSDGNLVIYDRANRSVFSTNTEGRGDNLSVQNDGNVVIYNAVGNSVWSSNK